MLLLVLALGVPGSTCWGEEGTLVVPGGTEAVARLFGFHHPAPADFIAALHRPLLESTDQDHKWKDVPARQTLVHYLEDLGKLRRRFPPPIEVGGSSPAGQKRFRALAEFIGFNVKGRRARIQLLPKDDPDAARRRRLVQALGWEITEITASVVAGDTVTLRVEDSEVPFPLTREEWQALVDQPVARIGTLEALAKDQRLSFVLEARRRLSADTIRVLDETGWHWLYRKASVPLARYAHAIRTVEGELLVPGGEQAIPTWANLVGVSPRRPAEFLGTLLGRHHARAAYVWHALSFVPPGVASFYLGSTRQDGGLVRGIYKRLDEASRTSFDSVRGDDFDFAGFVRSVPLTADGQGFDLPGGLGLWFQAIKAADMPRTRAELSRKAERGARRSPDDGRFLLDTLVETVNAGGHHRPVLQRLIVASNLLARHEDLMTGPNVIAVARTSDVYPSALAVLETMRIADPESISTYLLAVAHLASLDRSPESELLLINFQAGCEWLRVMARAGRVDAGWLERLLVEWSRSHLTASDPHSAAAGQLRWIADVLDGLPAARPDAPGRGPLERAMLQALTEPRDPQEFDWQGLSYRGERGLDFAVASATLLVTKGVPAADWLGELPSRLARLRQACEEGEVTAARELAAALAAEIEELPGSRLDDAVSDPQLAGRLLPVDRPLAIKLLRDIAKQSKPGRVRRKAADVERVRSLLAGELRVFLLAPAYLGALAGPDNLLARDPDIIRKHLLFDPRWAATGSVWAGATVEALPEEDIGAVVLGAPADLTQALAEYALALESGTHLSRDRIWYQDHKETAWYALRPPVTRLASLVVAAGREILARSAPELTGAGGAYAELVRRFIPLARLEPSAAGGVKGPVSISELFLLGYEASAAGGGEGDTLRLSPQLADQLAAARQALWPQWRAELDKVSVRTPHLDGSVHPSVGHWPPYESLESALLSRALIDRQLLDVRLALVDFLGRHSLPGVVGRDLMTRVLEDPGSRLGYDVRDWEAHVRWANGLDDAYFTEALRECLSEGLYSLRF